MKVSQPRQSRLLLTLFMDFKATFFMTTKDVALRFLAKRKASTMIQPNFDSYPVEKQIGIKNCVTKLSLFPYTTNSIKHGNSLSPHCFQHL